MNTPMGLGFDLAQSASSASFRSPPFATGLGVFCLARLSKQIIEMHRANTSMITAVDCYRIDINLASRSWLDTGGRVVEK